MVRVLPEFGPERKALDISSQGPHIGHDPPVEKAMSQTFDTIFRGGIVVNQDGEGPRDVGVRAGRIAALGDLAKASAGEVSTARACMCCPA